MVSVYKNGFTQPVPVSPSINTPGLEFNAFIAPDESFLIFSGYNRPDGLGSGDMYISYRNPDGSWRQSEHLPAGPNSKWMDYCPFVDIKTKTLYFTSRRSDVAQRTFSSVADFKREVNQYANGMSRIYAIPFTW